MALTEEQRKAVWREFMKLQSRDRDPLAGMTKQDIRDAVDAVDDWIDANASSFNQALPVAVRTNLTAGQKSRLLARVTRANYGGD